MRQGRQDTPAALCWYAMEAKPFGLELPDIDTVNGCSSSLCAVGSDFGHTYRLPREAASHCTAPMNGHMLGGTCLLLPWVIGSLHGVWWPANVPWL